MAIPCKGEWRHKRIIETRVESDGTYSFVDTDDMGRLYVDAEYGVIPRVGDPVSYYGHFGSSPYTLGPIEVLVIGERMVWDFREELRVNGL